MTKIIYAKPLIDEIEANIKKRAEELKSKNKIKKLAIIRLGDNKDDISYERSILKKCEKLGVLSKVYTYNKEISQDSLINEIKEINKDNEISSLLIFRPLPKHIDEKMIGDSIYFKKDIDAMGSKNLSELFIANDAYRKPNTPVAAIRLLKYYGIELEGKTVCIINRSLVFGKPISMMLLKENATPIICHSKTKGLKKITNNSDIVILATGKAEFFDRSYFNERSIIIDVGINFKNGKLVGDANFEQLNGFVKMISPVPGGVGSITTLALLEGVIK